MEDFGTELLEPPVKAFMLICHEYHYVGVGRQDVMHDNTKRAKVGDDPTEEGQHRLLAVVGAGVRASARACHTTSTASASANASMSPPPDNS